MTTKEFDEAFCKNYQYLLNYITKYSYNLKEPPEDILHTTYLHVRNKIHLFKIKKDGGFMAWMFKIITRRLQDIFRKEYRHKKLDWDAARKLRGRSNMCEIMYRKNEFMSQLFMYGDLRSEIEVRLQASEVERAIQKLSKKTQDILKMYYLGYEYCEIADTLKIPLNTVKTRIHRGKIRAQKISGHDVTVI